MLRVSIVFCVLMLLAPIDAVTVYASVRSGTDAESTSYASQLTSALYRHQLALLFLPGIPQPASAIPGGIQGSLSIVSVTPYDDSVDVVTIEFSELITAQQFFYLANTAANSTNLIRALNITSAQQRKPNLQSAERTVPVVILVILTVAVFFILAVVVGCAMRTRIVKKKRSVNFAELVALENEMRERCERKIGSGGNRVNL